MKVFNVAALVATASAVAPPRIELDLSAMSSTNALAAPITRTHDLSYTQPDGTAVTSRQDWTEKCPAGTATSEANCPFPSAKAYDHMDKEVTVTTRVFLVDLDGKATMTVGAVEQSLPLQVNQVNFAQRSTYLFKYDAHDQAGNRAEQVVFALILDDKTAPVIEMCGGVAETVEAKAYLPDEANRWTLCSDSKATDNIDGLVGITYTISCVDSTCATPPTTCVDSAPCDYTTASGVIDTNQVGKFLVTLCAHDDAGLYGTDSVNNNACLDKAVEVKDTRPPIISIDGASPITVECSHTYTDDGATASDYLDGVVTNNIVATESVDTATVGNAYFVKYNVKDNANNDAVEKTREVKVTDTTKPVIDMNVPSTATGFEGVIWANHVNHYTNYLGKNTTWGSADLPWDDGVSCSDACDQTAMTISGSWGPKDFNDRILGNYTRTFTCCDASSNCQTAERTFQVIDEDAPTIVVIPADCEGADAADCTVDGNTIDVTYEATNDDDYVDKGATCHDYVDGFYANGTPNYWNLHHNGEEAGHDATSADHDSMSHAIEVGGQVVNMRVPGTYVITYDCMDRSGNEAPQATRTVVVADRTCPRITLLGESRKYIEAGFAYVDSGATATDDLDGDITDGIWKDGDTVNVQSAFYTARSCREIYDMWENVDTVTKPATGPYVITTHRAAIGFSRQEVWCDMTNKRTYKAVHCADRITPYSTDQGVCASDYGLEMTQWGADHTTSAAYLAAVAHFDPIYFEVDNADQKTDYYLCSTNDHAGPEGLSATPHAKDWIAQSKHGPAKEGAEPGKYIIRYNVKDAHDNTECSCAADTCTPTKRTIIVRDSLPPVISLHLKGARIHVSKNDQVGIGGEANPAGDPAVNTQLAMTIPDSTLPNSFQVTPSNPVHMMAESAQTSSVNGWVIGAVASAVSGLALLASSRKASVTTVPV